MLPSVSWLPHFSVISLKYVICDKLFWVFICLFFLSFLFFFGHKIWERIKKQQHCLCLFPPEKRVSSGQLNVSLWPFVININYWDKAPPVAKRAISQWTHHIWSVAVAIQYFYTWSTELGRACFWNLNSCISTAKERCINVHECFQSAPQWNVLICCDHIGATWTHRPAPFLFSSSVLSIQCGAILQSHTTD